MSSKLANITQIYAQHPKLTKNDVNKLFEWLETQPHLPKLEELQIALFLHSCYYDIEATKTTVENYFTMRTGSDLFKNSNEEVLRRTLEISIVDVLPKTTTEGYIVWLFKFVDPAVEKFNCTETIRVMIMALCLHFHQHGPSDGLILLCDMNEVTFGHLFRTSVSAVRQVLHFLQGAAPTRIKGIHYINSVPVTKHLIALTRPFLKKEVYDVIRVHSNIAGLYEYVPKDCLPEDYGGEIEPLRDVHAKNVQNIMNHLDFFEWHDAQKVDESKRKKVQGFFSSFFFGKSG